MPSNWLYVDTNFPTFTGEESPDEKITTILNYMFMLVEQLRYTLHNLDLTNMNSTAVEQYGTSLTDPIYARIEDDEGNLTLLQVTAAGLASRVSDAEGNISTLQQTASSLTSQISDAQGDISILYQTAASMGSQISDLNGNISALQQTASSLTSRISNAEGDVSALQQTAASLTSMIGDVQGDISVLRQTASSLTSQISDANGNISILQQTVNGLTVTDSTGTTRIKGSSVETGTLYVSAANITGTLTASQINTTGLKVSAANITGTLTIGQLPSTVATTGEIPIYTSDLINDSGFQNSTQVTTITNNAISTATIKCSQIATGTMTMANGYLGDVTGSTGTTMTTGVGMMSSASGASCVATSAGARMSYNSANEIYVTAGKIGFKVGNVTLSWVPTGYFNPDSLYCFLGSSDYPWNVIYSKDGTVAKSDRNQKENIVYGLEDYDSFFDGLKPVSYKFIDGKRKHIGLISQDVEDNLIANGLTAMDFAGFCKDAKADGSGYDYALRYSEFIALCIYKIQKLQCEVGELKAALAAR